MEQKSPDMFNMFYQYFSVPDQLSYQISELHASGISTCWAQHKCNSSCKTCRKMKHFYPVLLQAAEQG